MKEKTTMIGVPVSPAILRYLKTRSFDGVARNVAGYVRALIEKDRTAYNAAKRQGGKNGR